MPLPPTVTVPVVPPLTTVFNAADDRNTEEPPTVTVEDAALFCKVMGVADAEPSTLVAALRLNWAAVSTKPPNDALAPVTRPPFAPTLRVPLPSLSLSALTAPTLPPALPVTVSTQLMLTPLVAVRPNATAMVLVVDG